jgi:hypothetical protein
MLVNNKKIIICCYKYVSVSLNEKEKNGGGRASAEITTNLVTSFTAVT